MNNDKKRTILILLLILQVKIANANDNAEIKIGASIDTQYGIINQNKDFRHNILESPSSRLLQRGLVSNDSIEINIKKQENDNSVYGGSIRLNANTSKTSSGSKQIASKVAVYLQNKYGRSEIGATSSTNKSNRITSYTNARGTGGLDGDCDKWIKFYGIDNEKNLSSLFLSSPSLSADNIGSKANKVNYFTPQINGFTFGISYVPDINVKGTAHTLNDNFKNAIHFFFITLILNHILSLCFFNFCVR